MSLIRVEYEGRIATVTLARPEKLNALNRQMLTELREAWKEVAENDTARVAILCGDGRAFSVGVDQGEGSARPGRPRTVATDHEQRRFLLETCFAAFDMPKPVISQVHGQCFGAGTLLPLLTDLIFVAEDAAIGWPKLPIGGGMLGPAWSWFVGPFRAKEFSFTVGTTLSGSEAVACGWGNHAVPLADLASETRVAAEGIARLPAELLALKKAAINRQMEAMGFRQAVLQGALFDAVSHNTDAVLGAGRRIPELGLKGAIAWFESEGLP